MKKFKREVALGSAKAKAFGELENEVLWNRRFLAFGKRLINKVR